MEVYANVPDAETGMDVHGVMWRPYYGIHALLPPVCVRARVCARARACVLIRARRHVVALIRHARAPAPSVCVHACECV